MTGPEIANASLDSAQVPRFPDKYGVAYPPDAGKTPGACEYVPVADVFQTRAATDAHFQAFSCPAVPYRLKKEAIGSARPRMVLAVFDVDDPEAHTSKTPARPEWLAAERARIDLLRKAHPGLLVYFTKGGYRIVGRTDFLIEDDADERMWSALYLEWVQYLADSFGIVADDSCKDWTRLYRVPFATRDGVPQEPEILGDPSAIGTWAPELSGDAAGRILAAREAVPEPFEDDDEPASDEIVEWARVHARAYPIAVEGRGGSKYAMGLAGGSGVPVGTLADPSPRGDSHRVESPM